MLLFFLCLLVFRKSINSCYQYHYAGIEPTACIPGVDWTVQSRGGTIFESVDLSEGDWAEYDESHDDSISVTDVVYVVEKC